MRMARFFFLVMAAASICLTVPVLTQASEKAKSTEPKKHQAAPHKHKEQELTKEQQEIAKRVEKLKRSDLLKKQEDELVIGSPDAPNTMIEYASFSCGHCASFANEVLPDLEKEYISKGKLKVYFRDFPLNEPAFRASMLVRCVEKNKRESFMKTLFKTQEKWAFDKEFMNKLLNIAKIGGVKEEEFKACMENKEIEKALLFNRLAAAKVLNVSGTPAIFINGEPAPVKNMEDARKYLETPKEEAPRKN